MRRFWPLLAFAIGCRGASTPSTVSPTLDALRRETASSSSGEVLGRLALAEMFEPGGTAEGAARATERLGDHHGLYSSLAKAIHASAHGEPETAALAFIETLKAAQGSSDVRAPLIGWFASQRLVLMRGAVADLYGRNKATIEGFLSNPGSLGWRAVATLGEWWALTLYDRTDTTGVQYAALVTERMGCAREVRIAGPFGHGSRADHRRTFAAEAPGPWPAAWSADALRGQTPRPLKTQRSRCSVATSESVPDGVFYAETYFETTAERELLISVQGALAVFIDDTNVLSRDAREWGSWQRFGAHVRVGPGRHRLLARLTSPATAIRLLVPDGTAAGIATSTDSSPSYSALPPTVLSDLNPVDAMVRQGRASSALDAVLGAYAAHVDNLDDVAAVLMEPYVQGPDAGALALDEAAVYAASDPALADDVKQRAARQLADKAFKRDAKLVRPRLRAMLDMGEQRGAAEVIEPLRALVADFPHEPALLDELGRLYSTLGWKAERLRTLRELTTKFPDYLQGLHSFRQALDDDGSVEEADLVAARIAKWDHDSEVGLERAIQRHDWPAAIAELERLALRRTDRKALVLRFADVLRRSGDPEKSASKLSEALLAHPKDSRTRGLLADRAYARGDKRAFGRALVEALAVGASVDALQGALDFVEGSTALEPYRMDPRKVIRDFEEWERRGSRMEGTAARVLDYATLWVHADGSSEMLEHEIQRMQSQEAVSKESEIEPPEGLVLRLRVIKPDGSTLEPEPVAGKPTLTYPHLAVGDYVEMEHITRRSGDGLEGRRYRSPHWFFREADKGYWRSEFIAVLPKGRAIVTETRGEVPAPVERDLGGLLERRWRVDLSPPAAVEPNSAPMTEFLPSVRLGWGVTLDDTMARLVDAAVDETPLDPRFVRIANTAARAGRTVDERARLLYRRVVENVRAGKETDPRRVLSGNSGSAQAAFYYLGRALGLGLEYTMVKSKLEMPPLGPMAEVESFDSPLLRLGTERGVRWLIVRDRLVPFGYVPAELRGGPAIRLVEGLPRDMVAADGALDSVVYTGRADVRANGSAAVTLTLTLTGAVAVGWRSELEKLPEGRLLEFVEKQVVGPAFEGGHAREATVEGRTATDDPLVLRLRIEVPELAKRIDGPEGQGGQLLLRPLFAPSLGQLANLPSRQSPMVRRKSLHSEVHFEVVFPEGVKLPASLPKGELRHGEARVVVSDVVRGHAIGLERVVELPAGRVEAGEDYARFRKFALESEALLGREVLLGR
ncbi:MAG: hypothetical protein WCI05_05435 [Myxococcales bacterium]